MVKAILPMGLPPTDFSPIIKLNAGIAIGSKTAPTVCNLPWGAKVVKKEFQSSDTLVVFKIKFNVPAIPSKASGFVESTTWCAPIFKITSFLFGLELKAVTSQPQAFKNLIAICPSPPTPITPTLSVGFTPDNTMGLKTVIPPQNKGPAFAISNPLGNGITHDQCPRTTSENPPWRPTIVACELPHKCWLPSKHWLQCIQALELHPMPTLSPIFKPLTSLPNTITSPTIS